MTASQSHLLSLKQRKTEAKKQIIYAYNHFWPDDKLRTLKKKYLYIQDEILELENEDNSVTIH